MKLTISERQYRLIGFENRSLIDENILLSDILIKKDNSLTDEYEYIYSLQDNSEEILKLEVNDSMYIQINRDVESHKGVLIRIS